MKRVVDLTRQEKIELIRRLQAREVNVIDGMIVELSPIIIVHGKDWDNPEKFSIGDQEFTPEEFEKALDLYPEGATLFFFPPKNKPEEE